MEVIGILTGGGHDGKIGGNLAHFERLGRLATQAGLELSLLDLNRRGEYAAYTWSHRRQAYVASSQDLVPQVLYNRIPTRELERAKLVAARMSAWERQGRVITNPRYLSKWEVDQVWRSTAKVRPFLLDIEPLRDSTDLARWLGERASFYLKPSEGKAGIGMMRVERERAGYHLCEQRKGQLRDFGIVTEADLNRYLSHQDRYGRYLLQEEARVASWGDRRFDVRVILHRVPDADFAVSGMAVRSSPQGSVTTHVPNGGTRAQATRVLRTVFGDRGSAIQARLLETSVAAANAVARLPGTWTELSIDASVQPDGTPILFEANAKPMKFDESAIELSGKKKLLGALASLAARMESGSRL